MKLFKKLGLGLFSLLAVISVITAVAPAIDVSAQGSGVARETAYFSGNTIKFRNVIYEFAGTNTANGGSTEGWGFYTVQGSTFSCGNQVIVDNPDAAQTVALRNTHSESLDIDNSIPAIGDDCLTDDINTQPWILNVTTEAICTEAGGAWSGSTCAFNSTPSQQRAASTTPPTGAGIPAGQNSGGGNAQGDELADTCESRTPAWGWMLCGSIDLIDGSITWTDNQIQRLLEVNEDRYTNDKLQDVWVTFRNLAYIILIPIMLIMVIGTAIGVEAFSAYTVRKALPRMVMAIIFITLSWYICTFLIGFFNAVGAGVNGLVTAPIRQTFITDTTDPNYVAACADGSLNLTCLFTPEDGVDGGAGILRGIITGVAQLGIVIGLVVFLWIFGTTLLIATATAFIVLFAREMFIIGLILMAPLAILAWIFPGNDKLWKAWWSLFSKLLMMFPLIMGIIAVGRIFAWIINESGGGMAEGAVMIPIMKLGAYLLPYAFIPFTFKFAGGVFANLAGVVNDKNKGLFDRAKKGRADKLARTANRRMFNKDTGIRGKLNTAGATVMGARKAGINPRNWKGNMGAHLSGLGMNQADAMLDDDEYKRWKGNDSLNRMANASNNRAELRKIMEESGEYDLSTAAGRKNLEMDLASAESMRKKYGNAAFKQATWLSAMAGGTAFDVADKNHKNYRKEQEILDTDDDATIRAKTEYNNQAREWNDTHAVYSSAEAAARTAGHDKSVQASLVAKGRGVAGQAGRVDQGGVSFGEGMAEIDQFLSGTTTIEESLNRTRRAVYARQGAGSLLHPGQKDSAVEHEASVMARELESALATASQSTGSNLRDEQNLIEAISQMAAVKAVHDSLGTTSPKKAGIVRNRVMSKEIDVGSLSSELQQILAPALTVTNPDGSTSFRTSGTITVTQALEAIEGDTRFQQFRKEYRSQFDNQVVAATAAQQAAAAATAATQTNQPPGAPPAGPAVGPPHP